MGIRIHSYLLQERRGLLSWKDRPVALVAVWHRSVQVVLQHPLRRMTDCIKREWSADISLHSMISSCDNWLSALSSALLFFASPGNRSAVLEMLVVCDGFSVYRCPDASLAFVVQARVEIIWVLVYFHKKKKVPALIPLL